MNFLRFTPFVMAIFFASSVLAADTVPKDKGYYGTISKIFEVAIEMENVKQQQVLEYTEALRSGKVGIIILIIKEVIAMPKGRFSIALRVGIVTALDVTWAVANYFTTTEERRKFVGDVWEKLKKIDWLPEGIRRKAILYVGEIYLPLLQEAIQEANA